jgi:hypothetical protein
MGCSKKRIGQERIQGGLIVEYYIGAENSSGMKFENKTDFLEEISRMIDRCKANGGTMFDIQVYTNEEV